MYHDDDVFWIELNKKVEAAKEKGETKKKTLDAAGVKMNTYSYNCNRLKLPRSHVPAKSVKTSPNGRFVEVTSKDPELQITYKGALLVLRNPTTHTIKQLLSALEE